MLESLKNHKNQKNPFLFEVEDENITKIILRICKSIGCQINNDKIVYFTEYGNKVEFQLRFDKQLNSIEFFRNSLNPQGCLIEFNNLVNKIKFMVGVKLGKNTYDEPIVYHHNTDRLAKVLLNDEYRNIDKIPCAAVVFHYFKNTEKLFSLAMDFCCKNIETIKKCSIGAGEKNVSDLTRYCKYILTKVSEK